MDCMRYLFWFDYKIVKVEGICIEIRLKMVGTALAEKSINYVEISNTIVAVQKKCQACK